MIVEVCPEIEQLVFDPPSSRTTCDPNIRVESCRFVAISVMWRSRPRKPFQQLRCLAERHITDRGSKTP